MQPQIHINCGSVAIAVIASFFFGWIWYGPLFGKKWAALMKFPTDFKPDSKVMIRSMVLTLVGTILTTWVMAHSVLIWRPSTSGVGADDTWCTYGFFGGFFTWLGFYVPQLFGTVAWEGKSWKLFGLNAAHHFLNLQLIAMILSCCR